MPHAQKSVLWRMMGSNAYLLSVIYLSVGVAMELLHKWRPSPTLEWVLDSLPARALQLAGLMPRIQEAYFNGQLSESWLRAIFSITTVIIIGGLTLVVGVALGLLRSLGSPRGGASERS